MHFCPNCGTQVSAGTSTCVSCGTPLPLERMTKPQGTDANKETFISSDQQFRESANLSAQNVGSSNNFEHVPYSIPQNLPSGSPSTAYGGSGYPPPSNIPVYENASYAPYQPYGTPQTPSSPNYGGNPAGLPSTPAYTQIPQAPYGSPGARNSFPTPQRPTGEKKRNNTLYVALGLLAVLLVGSGLWLIYYTTVSHPAELRVQATATVGARATANTRSTATVQAQATGTVQAQVNATATVQTQATMQAQATVTAQQTAYTQATSGTPDFSSPLTAQDDANWDLYDAVGGGGCAFSNAALHSSVVQKNYYVPCFALNSNYSNFAMQVQMTITKGDRGGLIFRADDANSKFYLFRVGQDGNYELFVSKDDKHSMSIVDDSSGAIKTGVGQTNLLTVIARNGTINLYINKTYVGSVSDATYTSGKIGVFASNSSAGTDVAFSNLQIWRL